MYNPWFNPNFKSFILFISQSNRVGWNNISFLKPYPQIYTFPEWQIAADLPNAALKNFIDGYSFLNILRFVTFFLSFF